MANPSRLRKAFRYPDEDNDDTPLDGLDEAEQETLIDDLRARDQSNTRLYTHIFLAIAAVSALPFLATIAYLGGSDSSSSSGNGSSAAATVFSALLSLSSLVCSAYILYYLPLPPAPAPQQRQGRDATEASLRRLRSFAREAGLDGGNDGSKGPIDRFLLPLNGVLCVMLALRGWAEERRTGAEGEMKLGLLPGIIFILVLIARVQLRPVDVAGLERLRYGYKGA